MSQADTTKTDPFADMDVAPESAQLNELVQSKQELVERVQNLKRELSDWRLKLDTQVKAYRTELGELRKTLNDEVEQLRTEFSDLRGTLKEQLEATARFATPDGEGEAV